MCNNAKLHSIHADTSRAEDLLDAIPARIDDRLLRSLCATALENLEAAVHLEMDYYQDARDARRISDRLDRVQKFRAGYEETK